MTGQDNKSEVNKASLGTFSSYEIILSYSLRSYIISFSFSAVNSSYSTTVSNLVMLSTIFSSSYLFSFLTNFEENIYLGVSVNYFRVWGLLIFLNCWVSYDEINFLIIFKKKIQFYKILFSKKWNCEKKY